MGVVYSAARGDSSRGTITEGLVFGVLVWAWSYVELVPLGIYEPPWR